MLKYASCVSIARKKEKWKKEKLTKKKRLESKMERQESKNTEGERGKKNFDEIDHT